MASREYLEEILSCVKEHLPAEDFAALNRAAIPKSGGRASWRGAGISKLEAFALRELRPAFLQRAEDAELAHLWAKLNQWYKRCRRRKENTEPYERAASKVAQEMIARGHAPTGKLMELAKSRASLGQRLEELPDAIVVTEGAERLICTDDGAIGVEGSYPTVLMEALEDVGLYLSDDASAELVQPLYDLALVRSSRLEKSEDQPEYLTKEEAHSGAMIALMAPDSLRDALKTSGLLQQGEPHVTLLYLGKAADLTEEQLQDVKEQVTAVCREHRPMRMKLSGIGKFAGGKDGAPTVALASAVGLSQLQADLERAVSKVIDLPSKHGWVPHLTLGYDLDLQSDTLPGDEWKAEAVTVKVAGDTLVKAPLEGKEPQEKAEWDNDLEPIEKVIRHEPNETKPWALYSRDGKKLLGRHDTKEQALAQERAIQVGKAVRIACSAPEKQIIYYLVSEPNTVDAHGHRIDAETIEEALHGYIANSREVKLEHLKTITGRAVVVEGFIAPVDMDTFHGEKPPEPIVRGSSIVAIHYTDAKLFDQLKNLDHGISWGGYARKVQK